MSGAWDPTAAGVLRLPSGRLVRGRGLRRPVGDAPPRGGAALRPVQPLPTPSGVTVSRKANLAAQENLADSYNTTDVELPPHLSRYRPSVGRWVGGSVGYVYYTDKVRFVGRCLGSVQDF
jgi:hypothetical protein